MLKKIIYSLVFLLLLACSDNYEEKEFPKAFIGSWTGKYIGNEINIVADTNSIVQIQFIESGIILNTRYHFDGKFLVLETPEVWYKMEYINPKEFKLAKEGDKKINSAINITGIVFKKAE